MRTRLGNGCESQEQLDCLKLASEQRWQQQGPGLAAAGAVGGCAMASPHATINLVSYTLLFYTIRTKQGNATPIVGERIQTPISELQLMNQSEVVCC